jgi:2-oxoglutarate ferredoxin oxidoreductase subunit gamma
MIVLGAFLKIKPLISLENVIHGIKDSLPARHHHLLAVNEDAVRRGMEIVREVL